MLCWLGGGLRSWVVEGMIPGHHPVYLGSYDNLSLI